MVELRGELEASASALEAAAHGARARLALAPEQFAWFGATVYQNTPAGEASIATTDEAAFYGGLIKNDSGDYGYGYVQSHIQEPIPEGELFDAVHSVDPAPFIQRTLDVRDGIFTVQSLTRNPSPRQGPVITESEADRNYILSTSYNAHDGGVIVRGGEGKTGLGHRTDGARLIEYDVFELPESIRVVRLASLIRTIKATSAIFEGIALGDLPNGKVEIQRQPPSYR